MLPPSVARPGSSDHLKLSIYDSNSTVSPDKSSVSSTIPPRLSISGTSPRNIDVRSFFTSRTGELMPYGGRGSPRASFLAAETLENPASPHQVQRQPGWSLASSLSSSMELKVESFIPAPAPVSAPPSYHTTPASSPPQRPAQAHLATPVLPQFDLGAVSAVPGRNFDEDSVMGVSHLPLKKRGEFISRFRHPPRSHHTPRAPEAPTRPVTTPPQAHSVTLFIRDPLPHSPAKVHPHKRPSAFTSKPSRTAALLPSALTKSTTITGSTQFTKPAQGALRMNKFVQRLHSALVSEQERDTVTWKKGCLVLHSVEVR